MRYSYTRRSLHRQGKSSLVSEENAKSPSPLYAMVPKNSTTFSKVQARRP
jgi:hypothetical protein